MVDKNNQGTYIYKILRSALQDRSAEAFFVTDRSGILQHFFLPTDTKLISKAETVNFLLN